ncbi:hemolysin family protein [Amphibacillus sp. MSJ-3]|uniref:hemolysin family protein n=1 Tax=Amphibacillus sp. MSJ-3 TaxID=2841505 RepID=UPI001C0EA507|nr:hemolysin family protein [Amphibacillus sp. MSJ-3]MBU5595136.1 hemolysin family protein [Amphibacillus sp. MSJ-3]
MGIAITTLIVLILINAFFAASELAFVNLNDNKVKHDAENGDKKAQKLYRLISNPSLFLSTIQIGITLAGFLSSAFAADFFASPLSQWLYDLGVPMSLGLLHTISVVVITIILSYFTLVFGELVPKQLALQKADKVANIALGPISILAKICLPIVKLLTFSINAILRLFGIDPSANSDEATEEDIRMLIDIGGERGTINQSERRMIENIFEFDDKVVSDITTHRTEMSTLSIDLGFDEVIQQINQYRYSRFPVYEGTVDNIIGVLHVKDLFQYLVQNDSKSFNLKDVIREPYFALEAQTIDVLFANMRKDNAHIAIVLDEFGGTEGLVTIEDVIEEIVGEISSESIEPGFSKEEIKQIAPNQYIMDGTFRLWELEDLLKVDLPTEEYDTVSGFLISQIGYILTEDERPTIVFKNLIFKVKKVVENRIETVAVMVKDNKLTDSETLEE